MLPLTHYFTKSSADDKLWATRICYPKHSGQSAVGDIHHATASSTRPADTPCPQPASTIICEELKVEMTEYALMHGQAAALRRYPAAKQSTLQRWVAKCRADRARALALAPAGAAAIGTHIGESTADLRVNNGRQLPADVYDSVFDWFHQMRAAGNAVSSLLLRSQVLHLVGSRHPHLLVENGGWLTCSNAMLASLRDQLNVSRRKATTAKRALVEKKEQIRDIFLSRVSFVCNQHGVPPSLAFHMDETGVLLLPVPKHTLHSRGSKVVTISHSDDKRQVTCIVGGDLAGGMLPGQMIMERAAASRLPKVEGLHITTSHNHWATDVTTMEWLETVLKPAAMEAKKKLQLEPDHAAVLLWDVFASHRSAAVRAHIEQHMPWLKLVYIPANCTDFLQPADVALNAPFKARLRELSSAWLASQLDAGTAPDLRIRRLRPLAATWTKQALDYVATTDAAKNGLKHIGLNHCWQAHKVAHARSLHEAGHLWNSMSRNDLVAPNGAAGAARVERGPDVSVVDLSESEDEKAAPPDASAASQAGTKRRRPYRCSVCKKLNHTKAACPILRQAKNEAKRRAAQLS